MLNRLYNEINAFVATNTLDNLHTIYLNEWYGVGRAHTTFRCDVAAVDRVYRFSRMDIDPNQCNRVHNNLILNSSSSGYFQFDGTYIDVSNSTDCVKIEAIVEVYK
jgi:hypothetical protein